jgi:light-harvesting complex I chlorophyll a/b binding protein 5
MNSPEMAVKEVKNGRLAMVAFIGIATGSLATREGPLAMLGAHLSSPFENNIVGSVAHLPDVVGKL